MLAVSIRRIAVACAFAGAAALAACNNTTGSNFNNPPCVLPANTQIALVYPAPGSTGIPTLLPGVVIASSVALPPSFDVVLSYAPSGVYGAAQYGFGIQPVLPPFASPNATPTFANPSYFVSAFNTTTTPQVLPPGQTITANYNDLNSSCAPTAFASFST